ncbi:MAG TPA: DUF362 domain-containing protein, partial [Acidobacteriota bacterium]|nr:DUF362 domain-containing protein [Acidobacteriota bacterium]
MSHSSDIENRIFLLKGSLSDAGPRQFGQAVSELGRLDKLRAARQIFVKVNLCAGSVMQPETGVNVSAGLCRALIEGLRQVNPGAKILIAESDSVGFGFAHDKFAFLGYDEMVREFEDVELADLTRSPYLKVDDPRGSLQRFMLPEALRESDFVISLSKIKTHNIVTVTGAMKNHFGTLPHQFKNVY